MNKFVKQKKYLQMISKRQLEAKERQRLEREVYYSEEFIEPDVWYTHIIEDHRWLKQHSQTRTLKRKPAACPLRLPI